MSLRFLLVQTINNQDIYINCSKIISMHHDHTGSVVVVCDGSMRYTLNTGYNIEEIANKIVGIMND